MDKDWFAEFGMGVVFALAAVGVITILILIGVAIKHIGGG